MMVRSRAVLHAANCMFKGYHSTQPLSVMLTIAEDLVKQKRYGKAQEQYQKIMNAYPNYENAYKSFFALHAQTIGPFGLTQSLWNHLQKKYLDAVEKYGEFSEKTDSSPKP